MSDTYEKLQTWILSLKDPVTGQLRADVVDDHNGIELNNNNGTINRTWLAKHLAVYDRSAFKSERCNRALKDLEVELGIVTANGKKPKTLIASQAQIERLRSEKDKLATKVLLLSAELNTAREKIKERDRKLAQFAEIRRIQIETGRNLPGLEVLPVVPKEIDNDASSAMADASKIATDLSVKTVRWYHPTKGTIFSGYDEKGRLHSVRVTPGRCDGPGRKCESGEIWHVEGVWERYRDSDQILADKCSLVKPNHGRLLISYMKESFPGIGPARAAKLFNYFDQQGLSLVDALDQRNIAALLDVLPSADMAEELVEQWHEKMAETQVVRGLSALGLPTRLANKLLNIWGTEALAVIEANPYFLLALLSWNKVDLIAQKRGIEARDERRLAGAVEAALYRRLEDKHTLTPHVALRTRVINLLNESVSGIAWPRAGVQTGELAIEIALGAGMVVGDRRQGYQTRAVADMEKYLADRMLAMIAGEEPKQRVLFDGKGGADTDVWKQLQDTLFDGYYLADIFAAYEHSHHRLTQKQKDAVTAVIERQIVILTGGAGTGKTSVMRVIHDVVRGKGGTIHQMALAGRAKERMREATGHDATTIAKFLRDVRLQKTIVSPDDLVIVDEASMTGLSTLYQIVSVLPKGAHLLLVGDPGQLPPIEFGLSFHVLADPGSAAPKVELTKVHRQAAETGIPQIALDVRNGVIPALGEYSGTRDGVTFVHCSPGEMAAKMFELLNDLGGIASTQIVGMVKGGVAGTQATNARFHEWLAEEFQRDVLTGECFAVGDPVLYLENDVELDLYNGTFGLVTGISQDKSKPGLFCQFEGKKQSDFIATENLYKLTLAYAVTAHKAQGSQFERVIIPILRSRLLDRTMLYTALTRARRQAVFVGDQRLFEAALVAPPSVALRDVGFTI